jgi:hypothetical protein
MEAYGVNGWTAPNGTQYEGYYTRFYQAGSTYEQTFGDWWQTTIDWTEGFAPGRTAYTGMAAVVLTGENTATWHDNSNVTGLPPTYAFMSTAAKNNDFVELGIEEFTENNNQLNFLSGHAVNLGNITTSIHGVETLTYQDPNYPTSGFFSTVLEPIEVDGEQFFYFVAPSGATYAGNDVLLMTAFTEAPATVPEPSSLALACLALPGLAAVTYFRRRRAKA